MDATTPLAGQQLELGLDTFGDVTLAADGTPRPAHEVIRNVVREAVLADQVGVDNIGLGEHHRADFAISAPDTVLAAIAGCTDRIRLGSAVTVLSSDDPVRVFQRFATLDAVSNGRAEVVLGRGSFTESFPLFGYPLGQYEVLFDEKLDLFAQLLREQPVTWAGTTRAELDGQEVVPTTAHGLRTWVGVGGSPQSVVRAASHGLPLVIAIIGGESARFKPLVDLYRRANAERGNPDLPVGVHSPGHIAATDEQAREQLWPHWQVMRNRLGGERGWGRTSKGEFDAAAGPNGALYAGSPETVARKIAATVRELGLRRFNLKYSHGTLPHDDMLRSIELYGTEVIPRVRELLAAEAERVPEPV
ncbi:MAG TPA: LLM class flavin-dependent oxidoreductase [Ilumatobacter sp.]|nr:LLM class flavin-dependent oxidoreductase [Ilumatobacter sp.]